MKHGIFAPGLIAILIAGTVFAFFTSASANAREHIIGQANLQFSVPLKVIKPGDRVTFVNNDSVVHNIISQTAGLQFDLGVFEPGMQKSVSFNQKNGVVDVECTVHPNMKLTLFIF
ncbi:MAG: methylamine utilization protein [Gammaproteobacteria bacterium]|nr:methylamine utilization protein [Gammaproteobacteria bacterium]